MEIKDKDTKHNLQVSVLERRDWDELANHFCQPWPCLSSLDKMSMQISFSISNHNLILLVLFLGPNPTVGF